MTEKIRAERRRLEDFLRKILLDLERSGRADDGLVLIQAVKEFVQGGNGRPLDVNLAPP